MGGGGAVPAARVTVAVLSLPPGGQAARGEQAGPEDRSGGQECCWGMPCSRTLFPCSKRRMRRWVSPDSRRLLGGHTVLLGDAVLTDLVSLQVLTSKGDAWAKYMAEVKKYKAHQCSDDDKTRPLVK
uniref:Uncharacterized protein n=1 Tax=Buteo japonicus TaxID=224669 RepID=A0A8C0AVN1_9AVES